MLEKKNHAYVCETYGKRYFKRPGGCFFAISLASFFSFNMQDSVQNSRESYQ